MFDLKLRIQKGATETRDHLIVCIIEAIDFLQAAFFVAIAKFGTCVNVNENENRLIDRPSVLLTTDES